MTNLEYIAANLSDEDILCQIAEEAAELAKAALKLRRAMTQTNPTPVTLEEAIDSLIEEYGDVVGAFTVYANKNKCENDLSELVSDNINAKYNRWAQRIKESKTMTDTIRELILRILDYVERTPGAYFAIAIWDEGVRKPDGNQMHFTLYNSFDDSICYISRDGDEYWSQIADLDEDNLRYLLSQLEATK